MPVALLLSTLAFSTRAPPLFRKSAPLAPATPLAMMRGEGAEEEESPLEIALAAVPAAVCFAVGSPWFATVHAPMLAVAVLVGAPPAGALVASTALYTTAAALFDADSAAIFALLGLNLAVLLLILGLAPDALADQLKAERDAPFAGWDAKLRELLSPEKKGPGE